MKKIYKEIYKEIKKNDKIIITTHIRADGDCVGSAIGLKEIIKSMFKNKDVKALYENLNYLPHLPKSDKCEDQEFENALIISVDNASLKRANDPRVVNVNKDRIIKIDHHPNNEPFGYINFVEDEKSACAEMIFDLFLSFPNSAISQIGIEALYTGILTDTGRFKYPSVTGDTMKKVGFMYDLGLDALKIINILDEVTIEELKFKGYVLEHFDVTENGVIYIKINEESRSAFNIEYDEASNMVNELANVKGYPIWILINEYKADEIRCRVRSIGVSINDIAEKFGGGGHKNASGIVVKDYDTVDKILSALDERAKEYKNNN